MYVLVLKLCIREEFFMGSSSYVGLFTIFMVIVSLTTIQPTVTHGQAGITSWELTTLLSVLKGIKVTWLPML